MNELQNLHARVIFFGNLTITEQKIIENSWEEYSKIRIHIALLKDTDKIEYLKFTFEDDNTSVYCLRSNLYDLKQCLNKQFIKRSAIRNLVGL